MIQGDTATAAAMVRVAVTAAIRVSGTPKRTTSATCSTSLVERAIRSPVPARLDRAEGQAEDAVEELLAQLGQHPLAEGVGGQAGHPDQHHLGDQGGQHGQGDLVDPPGGGAAADLVDQQAEQGRAGQPGHGGGGVQPDGQGQAAPVPPGQHPGPGPDLGGGRHRQPGHRRGACRRSGAPAVLPAAVLMAPPLG